MWDADDEGARAGLWVTLGLLALLLMGLVLALAWRARSAAVVKPPVATVSALVPSAQGLAASAAGSPAAQAEWVEAPLRGDLLGRLHFASGSARLPEDASRTLELAVRKLADAPERRLLLSGFHDATGDALKNAELAKRRALAVRDALVAAGADAARLRLRKPASAQGSGAAPEARRVELRLER